MSRVSEKSFGVEAQEHNIDESAGKDPFYNTDEYLKDQVAEFG